MVNRGGRSTVTSITNPCDIDVSDVNLHSESVMIIFRMKGLGISVPPLHAGVRFDLEALLVAFKAKNSVRYEVLKLLDKCWIGIKSSSAEAKTQLIVNHVCSRRCLTVFKSNF